MTDPTSLGVIDEFVVIFTRYIDSGFGLLGGEVQYLTAILIGIDITLAGLYWAMGSDSSVIGKFLKKVMYVGVFALIITNFSGLANIVFSSFGGLGLKATATTMTAEDLLRPGFIANTGFTAAHPILTQIGELTGPVKFFHNIVLIVALFLAWIITMFAFFFIAIQLFVTILEFKLTTLAGFILIPFALWNKTSFLAEKVLGNVVASGIKLMVLAIIVGIGSTIFGDITSAFAPPVDNPDMVMPITLKDAASIMLGSMALLALGIFGPGIATGLVSGAPQLGAGAAVGTMAAVGAGALAGGAVAGAGIKGVAKGGAVSIKAGASMAGGSKLAFTLGKMGSGASGIKGAAAGVAAVAQAGVMSVAKAGAGKALEAGGAISTAHTNGMRGSMHALSKGMKRMPKADPAGGGGDGKGPNWAKKVHRQQKTRHATRAASHAIRTSDSGGGGNGPALNPDG
jgi:type IV secretion system protein TrbL